MKKITKISSLVILLSCFFVLTTTNVFAQKEKPSPRYGHTFVTVNDTCMLLFGGDNGCKAIINEFWAYNKDNSEWEKKELDNPPPRVKHSAAVKDNKMIIFFGGSPSGLLSDIWQYDILTNSWEELPSGGAGTPEARKGCTASVMGNKVVIVGGETASGLTDEVWAFDLGDYTWEQKASYIGTVTGHAASVYNNTLFVFGGSDPPSFRNDMWSYDLRSNSWSYVNAGGSIPDESAYFGYSSSGQYFYIVGGNNDNKTVYDKSYMFDINTLTWVELGDDPALTQLAAAFTGDDMGNGELYTFGGLDAQGTVTDNFLCYSTINGTWTTVNTSQLEDTERTIDIYPNPFNNIITISGTDINSTVYIEIYDVLGKLVYVRNYKANEKEINLDSFDKGKYILKITNGNMIRTDKIVKR